MAAQRHHAIEIDGRTVKLSSVIRRSKHTPLKLCVCFSFFALASAILHRALSSRDISSDGFDWSVSSVASSPPWAQAIAVAGGDSQVTHIPRLKWPVHAATSVATCGPGGTITPQEALGIHSLQQGTQIHLDGSNPSFPCYDEHLDAGTCIDYKEAGSTGRSSRCIPILVIPGVQKAGTGTLRQFLARHKHLATGTGFSGAGKEINFFNSGHSTEDYLRVFPALKHPQHATEFYFDKSPNYLLGDTNGIFSKMRNIAPSMAIVIFLRNPTDRAFSAFKHGVRHAQFVKVRSTTAYEAASTEGGCNKGWKVRHVTHTDAQSGRVDAQVEMLEESTPDDFSCYLEAMRGDYLGGDRDVLHGGLYADRLRDVVAHFPREQVSCLPRCCFSVPRS